MAKKTDVTKSSKKDTGKDQKKKGGVRKYFRELKAEMKKVVWPTRQQVTKNTGVVLSVMVVMALFPISSSRAIISSSCLLFF